MWLSWAFLGAIQGMEYFVATCGYLGLFWEAIQGMDYYVATCGSLGLFWEAIKGMDQFVATCGSIGFLGGNAGHGLVCRHMWLFWAF